MLETIGRTGYQFLPEKVKDYVKRIRDNNIKAKRVDLPYLTEDQFKSILVDKLGLKSGDTIFIHSSLNALKLGFQPLQMLTIIKDIIGEGGTMLVPTYPRQPSYQFLISGESYDVRNTPSYTGAFTELLRTQPQAIRSLHPTKSVCALGPLARTLTESHQNSPYPYDECSPYYKIMHYHGVIIGLGVTTHYLSFVHCIDDALKEEFPVMPYHKKCFKARCINYEGELEIVETYGHNMHKMNHSVPRYMNKYISEKACQQLKSYDRDFFRADAGQLFNEMLELARRNITIYPKISYKLKRLI